MGGRYPPGHGIYLTAKVGTPVARVGTSQETEQHSEYLLHGRRYASCIHAGEHSC